MKPTIIALANQKGGVGKTTTAVNLGIWAGRDDKVAPSASKRLRRLLTAPLTETTFADAPHGLTYDPTFREPTADRVASFLAALTTTS